MAALAPSLEPPFELTGGALCLDFVNTLGDRPGGTEERLGSYADLVRWGREAGILDAGRASRLARRARRRTAEAGAAFARALALRETLYRVFSGEARGLPPEAADLARLNQALAEALPRLRVVSDSRDWRWGWAGAAALDRVLWAVVRSAADLLTSEERRQVRECASERCSWLFVDRSRTRRRRWCDMRSCGNRDKARRHYQRLRAHPRVGEATRRSGG